MWSHPKRAQSQCSFISISNELWLGGLEGVGIVWSGFCLPVIQETVTFHNDNNDTVSGLLVIDDT